MILRVERPGTLTTVQYLGRPGRGRLGVPVSGAMDPVALRAANALLGNAPGAAAIEITGPGLVLDLEGDGVVALAGADLAAHLDGAAVAPWTRLRVRGRARLTCEGRRHGARACLAVPGGLDAPLVMGSAATDLDAGLGAPLRRGDVLRARGAGAGAHTGADDDALARVRRWYADGAIAYLPAGPPRLDGAYTVSARSSRMGFRLEGAPLDVPAADAISEPIAPGAIQLTADGLPVLLMADRPTVGGYPVVGHVIRAHLPRAAQLWPGDPVRFAPATLDDSWRLAREQERDLAALEARP